VESGIFIIRCVICTGCGRKTWRFLSPVILATMWYGVMQPRSVASWFHAVSVAIEPEVAFYGGISKAEFSSLSLEP